MGSLLVGHRSDRHQPVHNGADHNNGILAGSAEVAIGSSLVPELSFGAVSESPFIRPTTPPSDSWLSATSGSWATASSWSTGVPSASTNVTISASGGAYTVTIGTGYAAAANALLLNSASATLVDSGTLSVGTLTISSGTFALENGGTIDNATISESGSGTLVFGQESAAGTDNTCSGVTFDGPLNVTESNASTYSYLVLQGTTTVTGANGSGAGTINVVTFEGNIVGSTLAILGALNDVSTINLTGLSTIAFSGNRVIDNCTVTATNNSNASFSQIDLDVTYESQTTTFGHNFVFNQDGAGWTEIEISTAPGTLVNQGTIMAASAGGTLEIGQSDSYGTSTGTQAVFINQGLLEVSNGEICYLVPEAWSNTGTILDAGGTLNLGGTFTTAILDTVTHLSGSLNLAGLQDNPQFMNNANATLTVGAGTALGTVGLGYYADDPGIISGGTIADSGGGLAILDGTLTGVTYEGVISLAETDATLTLNGGTEVTGVGGTGSGTISLTGSGAELQIYNALSNVGAISATGDGDSITFWETRTINNMILTLGTNDTASDSLTFATVGSQATLTLGPQFDMIQVGTGVVYFDLYGNDSVINEGIIAAEGTLSTGSSGGTFYFGYDSNLGATSSLSNLGTIAAYNNDSIYFTLVSLTNSGLLSASVGGTLNLTGVGSITNLVAGTLTGGTLSLGQASVLELANNVVIVTDSASITLSSFGSSIQSYNTSTDLQVGIESTLKSISAVGTLALLDGRNWTATANSGTFTDAGTLILQGSTFTASSLDISSGTISGSGSIIAPLLNSGSSVFEGGAILLDGVLSGAGTFSIVSGASLTLNDGCSLAGTILDSGVLTLASASFAATDLAIDSGGVLAGTGTWSGTVTDAGLIDATSGTLSLAGFSVGATLTAGQSLEAQAGACLLLENNAGITADAGAITLSGLGSSIQWLNSNTQSLVSLDTSLSAIKAGGTLSLLAGRSFTATANSGTFTDSGSLVLGGGTFSATKITLGAGAAISGSGTIAGKIASSGGVTLSNGSLALTGPLSGTGSITIAVNETTTFDSATSQSYSGTLIDNGTIRLAGAILTSASVSLSAGSTLTGFGTLGGSISISGLTDIDATGGTLSVAALTSSGGTLNAGHIEADAGSVLQLASNMTISTLLSSATLSGAGSLIQSLNTSSNTEVTIDSTLANIGVGGMFTVTNGRSFSVGANGGRLTDGGTLSIGSGGTFTATNVTVSSTGTLIDDGSYTGGITNSGQVMILDGNTMTLNSGTALGGTFTGSGTLSLTGATPYTISPTTLISLDTLLVAAGATLSGTGTIATGIDGTGTISAQGGTLVLDGSLRGSFTLGVGSGSTLKLADGSHFFGSIVGSGANIAVVNDDQVSGTAYAASLGGSGTLIVSNAAGGEFYGASSGIIAIAGSQGQTIINNAGAIFGKQTGISVSGTLNTITNTGFVEADNGAAISVTSGQTTIINTGTIVNYLSSGAAIAFASSASSTLTNAGTIDGGYYLSSPGVAVQFGNAGNNRLIVDPGASFSGSVLGGTSTNILELASGSGGGTISGLGTNFVGFTSTQVDANAAWTLSGANTISSTNAVSLSAGSSLTIQGSLTETSGTIANAGSFIISSSGSLIGSGVVSGTTTLLNNGFLEASYGTLTIGDSLSGSGSVAIGQSSTLIGSDAFDTSTLSFLGNAGDLELAAPGNFVGVIADFNSSDTIDLLGIVATGDTFNNNTLTLSGGSGHIASFDFSGNFGGETFTLTSDGHNGTLINLT